MLRIYAREVDRLALVNAPDSGVQRTYVWFDLVSPLAAERRIVEDEFGIELPTRDEMEEIELSARLFQEDGAAFMTMTALAGLDGELPRKAPLTFVLKGDKVVTLRHAEHRPFESHAARLGRPNGSTVGLTGEVVMIGLIEAMTDRLADTLERLANEIDAISGEIFRGKASNATKKTHDLQSLIEQIGTKGDFLTMIRESLVSISRLTAYHAALETDDRVMAKELRPRLKLVQRDAVSLGEHAASMSAKINFLLDATLGLINLEQNKIIKIFTVASVVFLPPTLVASVYGMNFDVMPELKWGIGYPWAMLLMVLSAAMPFLYFKKRGWL
jgi:magnesium transporter